MDLYSNIAVSSASGSSAAMSQRRRWSKEEDQYLATQVRGYLEHGTAVDWRRVAKGLENRSNKDCRKRWLKIDTKWHQGPWSKSEDERLKRGYAMYHSRWRAVSDIVETRNPDQCAKRWRNALDPNLERGEWNKDSDARLLLAVGQLGRNWKDIEKEYFPGRSRLDLSNRYTMLDRRRRTQTRRAPSILSKRSAASTPELICSSSSTRSMSSPTPEVGELMMHTPEPQGWDKSFNGLGFAPLQTSPTHYLPSELPTSAPSYHSYPEPAIKVEDWSLPSTQITSAPLQPLVIDTSSVCSTPYMPLLDEWTAPKMPSLIDAPQMYTPSYTSTPMMQCHSPAPTSAPMMQCASPVPMQCHSPAPMQCASPISIQCASPVPMLCHSPTAMSRAGTPPIKQESPRRTISLDNLDDPTRAVIFEALCGGNKRVSLVID